MVASARLARFYGFSISEIDQLTMHEIVDYLTLIDRLKSEEMMQSIQVACFPNMKKENRERFERSLDKAVNPDKYKPRPIEHSELGNVINGMTNA